MIRRQENAPRRTTALNAPSNNNNASLPETRATVSDGTPGSAP